jgi:cytochrome P450
LGTTIRGFQQYGEIVRYRVGPRLIHILSHPELAYHVLVEHAQEFPKLDQSSGLGAVMGNGLLGNSNQGSWLTQRRMMQPMFHRKRLAGFSERIIAVGERMLGRWQAYRPGHVVNMAEEMMQFTLDTITTTMFSADVIGPAVGVGVRYAQNKIQNPLAAPSSWPTPLNRAFKEARRTMDEIVYALIRERRASGVKHGDLLDMLLEARDEDGGKGMDDEQVHDEVLTMFVAGHDTTANALTWTWYLLSQHPEVFARMQAEVDSVLNGRTPALEDLPSLSYVQQVFNETLRAYPAVPQVGPRRVLNDTTLRGYHVPAGSRLICSIYNIHHHPDFWPEPGVFNPDRWTEEKSAARHKLAFMPFGAGSRLCIGYSLALMEAHLLIALVAQHYEPRLVPGSKVEPEVAIIMRPRNGLPMTLHPRT